MPVKKSSSGTPSPILNTPSVPHLLSSQHQFNSNPGPGVSSPSVKASPSLPSITRSASPSGLSNFFSRPTKWFTRSSSNSSRASPVDGTHHPGSTVGGRTSSSSTSSKRRPTISGPTDPRPIESAASPGLDAKLTGLGTGGLVGLNDRASRSVLDLSSRASTDLVGASSSSSGCIGSATPTGSSGTGDLRGIARKGWSRSVDNLQIIPPSKVTVNTADWETRVEQYRTGTPTTPGSLGSMNMAINQGQRDNQNQNQKIYPFPTMPGTPGRPSTPPTDGPVYSQLYQQQLPHQRQLRHAHSNSGSSSSIGIPTPVGPGSGPGSSPTPSYSPVARLAPPPMASPQKAGRKRSFDFDRPKASKSLDAGISLSSSGSGGRSGGGFPFFGAHPERKNSTPTPVHAPPTIVEPGSSKEPTEEEDGGNKRASQIVHRSGFILRLPNFNPSSPAGLQQQLASNKNWKPFKMVLRGAKLYFYKPPSDRGGAIKELFPTRLVTLEEEADAEEGQEDDSGAGQYLRQQDAQTGPGRGGNRGDEARKRRAFWGRRTHPNLVVVVSDSDQKRRVVRGTLEALVHESVFGTTFHSGSDGNEADNAEDAWREFASSVLFFLPYLVNDRAKFEHEIVRCANFFVSGAEESERDEASKRVWWLVERYTSYHSPNMPAIGGETWREFVREVVGPTESTVTPANGEQRAAEEGSSSPSPNLNTFSPRTGDTDRMPSLASSMCLGTPDLSSNSPSPSPSPSPSSAAQSSPHSGTGSGKPTTSTSTSRMRLWSLLSATGFTREVFFKLDPDTVARSLMLYQKSLLDSVFDSASGNASVNADLLLADSPTSPLIEFFGCDEMPHWLTRTVVMQILGPGHGPRAKSGTTLRDFGAAVDEDASLPSPGGHVQQPTGNSNSRTHMRAEVISRWTRVAEMSRLAGDECTYQAIFAALSSQPIARLEKAWRRVDSTATNIVKNWVYAATTSPTLTNGSGTDEENARTGTADGDAPRVSPWGGDARYRAMKLLERMRAEKESEKEKRGTASDEWRVEGMYEARRLFDEFVASVDACRAARSRSMERSRSREPSDEEDVLHLVQHWQEFSKQPLPMKIYRINQFMSLSFAAEPKKKGFFSPYYWTRHATPLHGQQVLTPLLMPELLPTITLIERSQLLRTKKLSYESNVVLGDSQVVRPSELMYTIESDGKIRAGSARGSGTFDLGGMILPVFDGELLLCVVSNPDPGASSSSRPGTAATESSTTPSRQPSIRVRSAAAGVDRKNSRVKRASLPVLSQRDRDRNNGPPTVVVVEPNGESYLHAVIQAGTLDALVHFLIYGLEGVSVSVTDDNGEMALHDKKTRTVKVDRGEFARIWWPSFRSFVTPYVLFQLLRKDFLSSSPSRGYAESNEGSVQAIQARLAVIRVIAEWIHVGSGAQDALDDVELHAAMYCFLASQNGEHDLSKLVSNLNSNASQSPSSTFRRSEQLASLLKTYEEERLALFSAFRALTMRPLLRNVPARGQSSGDAAHNFGIRPPKLEAITPSELVDNLDAMASAAFRNVNQEDLYVTADLLEVQTSDRTGWFLPREPSSITDEAEVQSLYTYLMEVEPTSLIGEYSGETLYRLLPPGIRTLLRAFVILRKWAVCCLAANQIGIKARQACMEMFLQAIEIARMRSAETQTPVPFEPNPILQPRIRTFVEAVLTYAIVSPESRAFARAWQNVAASRGVQFESVASLLAARTIDSPTKEDKLTVDPAWLLERMLEVISLSDVLDSPMDMDTPLSLVNFDKRRQLDNIITNTSSYVSRGSRQRREMDRIDFERLNRIEQEFGDVIFDLRMLKDEAQREAASLGAPATPSKKSTPRPFHKVVVTQQEKIKRDRYLRERLTKEKRHEQQRLERKEDDLNRAMDARSQSQSSNNPKHMRGKKSMSALFNLMRPISTAFTSESAIAPKRSAAELDFTPSNKPALVLSLVDARVTPFINNDRSFTFQIDTEDGGHYLLQALSKNDVNQWMQTINTSIKSHAQRRLTYMGNSSPIQITDQVQPRPATASRDPRAVFGVDLTFLVRREAGGEEPAPDAVPFVLELCLKEIEQRGLTEQGIYRVAGATSEVNTLREALNNGQKRIDKHTDINSVCGVVKYWFRNLPESVIPETYFEPILEAARIPDLDERLKGIRDIVQTFPRAHFSVLKRLAEHMDRVVDHEEQNHMTPDNLAVVICPNLVRAPNNNFGLIMTNMGAMTVLFKALITHMHFIFDEETVEEAEENEENGDDEERQVDEYERTPIDTQSLFVPEPDLGPRFVASPEPDELLQESGPSPNR